MVFNWSFIARYVGRERERERDDRKSFVIINIFCSRDDLFVGQNDRCSSRLVLLAFLAALLCLSFVLGSN